MVLHPAPDLTKKQRDEEAERRNKNLSENDVSKNLHWVVVGPRGERRLTKEKKDTEWNTTGRRMTRGGQRDGRGGQTRGGATGRRILTEANSVARGPAKTATTVHRREKDSETEMMEETAETESEEDTETETELEPATVPEPAKETGTKRTKRKQRSGGAEAEGQRRRGRGGGASSEEIVILYLNAQSIVKKIDKLCCVADSVKPDLILVTESWCNGDISDAYLGIDGYELLPDLRQDRENTAKGRGGGLLVYAKSSVKVLKLDNNVMFQQYCKFMIDDVTIYLVYRSPSSPLEAIVELENLVKSLSRNSILIGDFNMPDIDWEAWTGARKSVGFLDAVEDALLEQMVNFPTHIKGNCLDLVLTNIPERIINVEEMGRLGASDHEMILVSVAMQGGREESEKSGLNWRKANWDGMREDLTAVD